MSPGHGERSDGKCAVAGGTYSAEVPADESPEMTEGYEGFYPWRA